MTKADLVEKVTAQIARTAGPLISKKDCARVVDSFLDAVKAALAEQHNIEIRGFGTFKIRQRKTRMARNPRTGDPVEVAARPVPVFKPSKELRAMVADLNGALAENFNMHLQYSDALAAADLSRVELLHPIDGWHASVEGHNVLAEAAFRDLGPSLEFLGLK